MQARRALRGVGWARLANGWRRLAWFVNGVLGANKYQQYLAYHRRYGHGEPLSESKFWRSEADRQDGETAGRCC
ncbi:MAG: YbdD/YjiX family protein [Propionibacteriaceae bacterium]|nr:YbdD/YjiX family protein [Propionibacteriaceae bacterium]